MCKEYFAWNTNILVTVCKTCCSSHYLEKLEKETNHYPQWQYHMVKLSSLITCKCAYVDTTLCVHRRGHVRASRRKKEREREVKKNVDERIHIIDVDVVAFDWFCKENK